MSFICGFCGVVQPDRSKPVRVVVKTRDKVYPDRLYKVGGLEVEDPGGRGFEIAKEVDSCGCDSK